MTTPTSHEAATLLDQATTATGAARGISTWPLIAMQLGIGASTALYLFSHRDSAFDVVAFIAMMVWVVASIIFGTTQAKVAKQNFGARWAVFMALWGVCWIVGMIGFFPHAAVVMGSILTVGTFASAIWEARA